MTPHHAKEIYWAASLQAYRKRQDTWSNPKTQHEADIEAWQAVLNDPDTDEAKAALKAYLDAKSDTRSNPHAVQRLWDDYCEVCRIEMERNK